MASYLNKYGFIKWFSDNVVNLVGGLGLSWQSSFAVVVLLYFYSHYLFATWSSTRWSHVHCFPVCSHSMWYTWHACCHCLGPTVKCHGLLVHIRYWLSTPLLWSRVFASIKVVPAGFHHVSVLPGCLVVCWRSMVETYWPVVVNFLNLMQ